MKTNAGWALLALVIFGARLTRADSFTFTADFPGGTHTIAYGINNRGQIVGTTLSNPADQIGFLDTHGVFTVIDAVPSGITPTPSTIAYGINNFGQIVGDSTEGGFTYLNGAFTVINPPGPATSINDSGQLVGSFLTGPSTRGFLDSNGTLTPITVPGANPGFTWVNGVNNAGQIVGYFDDPDGLNGFLDTNGVFTTVDVPGSTSTRAYGINDEGDIVGCTSAQLNCSHAFVDINGVFTTFDFPGASSTIAFGINDAGQIVGSFVDSSGQKHGFLATPTPEPGSLLLLTFSLIGIQVLMGVLRVFRRIPQSRRD